MPWSTLINTEASDLFAHQRARQGTIFGLQPQVPDDFLKLAGGPTNSLGLARHARSKGVLVFGIHVFFFHASLGGVLVGFAAGTGRHKRQMGKDAGLAECPVAHGESPQN